MNTVRLLALFGFLALSHALTIEEIPEAPAEYQEKTSILENAVSPKLHADLAEASRILGSADVAHKHLRSLWTPAVAKKMKEGGNDVSSLSELASEGVAELQSVVLQARRVWEGHHKSYGADLAIFNWARAAKKVLDRRFTDSKKTEFYGNEVMLVRAEINALAQLAAKGGNVAMFGGPLIHQRVLATIEVLRSALASWEKLVQEVIKSLNATRMIVTTLYPKKPAMSGMGKKSPTNAEVWNALAGLRAEVFNKAYNEALQLAIAPSDVENFTEALVALSNQPVTAARMERLANLKGLEEVTSVRLAGKVLSLADRYMAASQAKPKELVRVAELDDLLAEMDYFMYFYDVELPGSVLHRAQATLFSLSQEEQQWASAADVDTAKLVTDVAATYRATLVLSQAKFSTVLVPLVAQARENLANIIY